MKASILPVGLEQLATSVTLPRRYATGAGGSLVGCSAGMRTVLFEFSS